MTEPLPLVHPSYMYSTGQNYVAENRELAAAQMGSMDKAGNYHRTNLKGYSTCEQGWSKR